ncbi:hypothetical protein IE53DRAFT_119796 [Violaceomyces palustris]|uniref:Uncharacterized protein n=1 Tax=Violaceomyces palustris TaxID=1673888 RepID=A0ACD0NVZ8_9BASI|nr:hypothetical protein IE53DRAFT_119796 [Violaceomyces palustris]
MASHIQELFDLLKAQGDGAYIGESISQLEHSLQAAHFAEEQGSDPDTIIAALLHDVGQFLPMNHQLLQTAAAAAKTKQALSREAFEEMPDEKGESVGRMGHDVIGESYLRSKGWPPSVYKLVGAHVQAKRYLSREAEYQSKLSEASKASLRHQGGPMNEGEAQEFSEDPLWEKKILLRICDDRSKVVGLKTKRLDEYRQMALSVWQSHQRGQGVVVGGEKA